MTRYLTAEEVFVIARVAMDSAPQVRDVGLLDSACHRPAASAFGEDAYPTRIINAAALLHLLTADHPFVDGNKRTAWLATVVFLRDNEAQVVAVDDDDGAVTDLVLAIADGSLWDVDDIAGRLAPMVIEGSEADRSLTTQCSYGSSGC